MEKWTCSGSVRGGCGITHRSYGAAERCCERDGRQCRDGGGYSDRSPIARDDATRAAVRAEEEREHRRVMHEAQWRAKREQEYSEDYPAGPIVAAAAQSLPIPYLRS